MDGYLRRLEGAANEALSGPDDGALERLHRFLLASVDGVPLAADVPPADDRVVTACFAGKMALELGTSDPDVQRRVTATFAVVAESLAQCVRAAQRNGDLDPEADPNALAWLLLTVTRGMDVIGATGQEPGRLTSIAESAFDSLPLRRPQPAPKPQPR